MTPEQLESRLVWIMGSPRTGSTWLLRLLCHPRSLARTPSGFSPTRLRGRGPDVVAVDESYLLHHLGPMREALPAPGGSPLLNTQRASDPAYFFSDAYEASWRDGVRELALERFAAQVSIARDEHGIGPEPLVVIKEPNGSHAAELIPRTLPSSRIVFLLRDGRDVIDSMIDADLPDGWRVRNEGVEPLRSPEQRLAAVRRHAELWLIRTAAVERACAELDKEQTILVRYEDLLADTVGELTRLDRWLGLGRDRAALRRAARVHRFGSLRNRLRGRRKGVRAATPGLWRTNLSEAEQSLASELLGERLAALGYER